MDSSELSLLVQKTFQSLRRQTEKNKKLRAELKALREAFAEFNAHTTVRLSDEFQTVDQIVGQRGPYMRLYRTFNSLPRRIR